MKNLLSIIYKILTPKFFLNNIWHKQIFRKYFYNTKNIFFNEFIITNILDTDLLENYKKNNRTEINIPNVKLLNSDLWSNYVLLWRHEEQQRLLDQLFMKSRYFKKLDNLDYNKNTKSHIKSNNFKYNLDLSLWYQLGYSIDILSDLNKNFDNKIFMQFNRSNILLEESLEYQHKLNTHLVGVLDYLSSLYEKDVFVQAKTFRGIFLRFFREILYPWFSAFTLTLMTFFSVISEILYLISSFVAIPLLLILFFYLILTDAITNFDMETVWLQINFFDFFFQFFTFYNPKILFIDDVTFSIYFNNFCWICIYLFFFFMLLFEGAAWIGILIGEEDNTNHDIYTDEGTVYEDISDSCQLRVLELMLDLADTDFTNIDYNNYYIFSENSDEFRDIESGFSDLNQFALQLFGGGIGIYYMMQLFIEQDDIDDNEFADLEYYEGVTRQNQDYEDEPELEIGSFISYEHETDSSFGLYEYPLDAGEIHFNRYEDDYNLFDEEGANIEGYVASPASGFEIFSENTLNYFFEYIIGISIFDFFLYFIGFFYALIYLKIYYDWEVWVYREYAAREYFQRISYLGWQHSLTNEDVLSDEDLINNTTILDHSSYNISGNEQLNFSRDIDPHITDIEFFFEDLETIIDFKNEFFTEEDYEFIDQDEFDAIFDSLEMKAINYDKEFVDESIISKNLDNSFDFDYMGEVSLNNSNSDVFNINLFDVYKNIKLVILHNKNNLNYLKLCQELLQLSDIFIFIYKNINKISNPILKNQLLFLIYFNINFKKLLLKKLLINIDRISNHQILFWKIEVQQKNFSQIALKIQDEFIELLIDDTFKNNLTNSINDLFEEFLLEDDLNDFQLFQNNFEYFEEKAYFTFNLLKNSLIRPFNQQLNDYYDPLSVYPTFFQINIIGGNNYFILDEENDLQFFFLDFEDDIEYFNLDTFDVDTTLNDEIFEVDGQSSENDEMEEERKNDFIDSINVHNGHPDVNYDDLLPDTVYNDDENPYDLFSYDFFFNKKLNTIILKNHQFNLLNFVTLKKKFFTLQNSFIFEHYNEKLYAKFYNNFFIYSWSITDLENNISLQPTLYNVTNILDLEFDTNYVEIDDDELYDDAHFLVPTQRLLIQNLINNYRYEYNSWLDGWGTWSFLNYNKFEGTLHTFFDYEVFHLDDEYDVDEEDMLEMNLTVFVDNFEDLYDQLNDDPSDFDDAIPDLSSLFDDLDDFEEDLVEISYLVEKPYIFLIICILLFECTIIFLIEYYFVFIIFLEPENGDNLFSDLFDFRNTGLFFDMLKLKAYSIYLFIWDFLTFENNILNEIRTYNWIYNTIFSVLDDPTSVGIQYSYLQDTGKQSVMLFFYQLYETYFIKLMNYFYIDELPDDEEEQEKAMSAIYYQLFLDEGKKIASKSFFYILYSSELMDILITQYTYYLYFVYYKCYEIYLEFLDLLLFGIQLLINSFTILNMFLNYIYLNILLFWNLIVSLPYTISAIMHFFSNLILYCILFGNILEILHIIPNVSFIEFNNILSVFLFLWRFNYIMCLFDIDYLFYMVYTSILINLSDILSLQLFSLLDFLQTFKKTIFIQNLYYSYTYQYVMQNVIKEIVLVTKPIIKVISFMEFSIIQIYLAQKNLYIIMCNYFSTFINTFLYENYFYLFMTIVNLNLNKIYLLFFLISSIIFTYIIKLILILFFIIQLYNYDLYFIYYYSILFYIFSFINNIYLQNDQVTDLKVYTINRHQQFDDKFYYNKETMFNYFPEILYDIETLTFINNAYNSYIYWY